MANVIEFCGAPGVGKSTVYLALHNRWRESFDWMPAHKVYPRKKTLHPLKRLVKVVLNENNHHDEKAMRKAASRFIAHYPSYIDECWRHILKEEKVSINKTDQRFEKATHIFKTIQRIQICRETLAAKTVIIEEGLVNEIGNALHKSKENTVIEEEIENLYDRIPLPEGLIFFEANTETILQRLKERKRFVPFLDNMGETDLSKAINKMCCLRKTAVELYRKRGFPVLYLNATDTVTHNTERALKFLRDFNHNLPVQTTQIST